MNAVPYSITNPPNAPKKERRSNRFRLGWWNQRNLALELEVERRKQQLREAEEAIYVRRRRETEERFLWLRQDYSNPPLDGPHPQPTGEVLYL